MPNWTRNNVTVEGDAETLKMISDAEFDFQTMHPCPFISGSGEDTVSQEGWYEWCCNHWGTKWTARDIDIDYTEGETILTANFNTAWCAPHGVLAYMTTIFPALKITNEWQQEGYECVGITSYCEGVFVSKSIDPSEYTHEALEAFAASNTWFEYEDYVADTYQGDEETLEEEDNRLETLVRVRTRRSTYDDYVGAQGSMFGFTDVEAAVEPPPEPQAEPQAESV